MKKGCVFFALGIFVLFFGYFGSATGNQDRFKNPNPGIGQKSYDFALSDPAVDRNGYLTVNATSLRGDFFGFMPFLVYQGSQLNGSVPKRGVAKQIRLVEGVSTKLTFFKARSLVLGRARYCSYPFGIIINYRDKYPEPANRKADNHVHGFVPAFNRYPRIESPLTFYGNSVIDGGSTTVHTVDTLVGKMITMNIQFKVSNCGFDDIRRGEIHVRQKGVWASGGELPKSHDLLRGKISCPFVRRGQTIALDTPIRILWVNTSRITLEFKTTEGAVLNNNADFWFDLHLRIFGR